MDIIIPGCLETLEKIKLLALATPENLNIIKSKNSHKLIHISNSYLYFPLLSSSPLPKCYNPIGHTRPATVPLTPAKHPHRPSNGVVSPAVSDNRNYSRSRTVLRGSRGRVENRRSDIVFNESILYKKFNVQFSYSY